MSDTLYKQPPVIGADSVYASSLLKPGVLAFALPVLVFDALLGGMGLRVPH
jgi:hypothetical protein